ncbi:MAG: hypothetical protein H0V04_07180 [Chloroflexi bacterium]|nr:hypothetical protein [Chloroflexota bacterium]
MPRTPRVVRLFTTGWLATVAVLMLTTTAFAGGSATATIADVPPDPGAGEEQVIGIEVRQHGVTPISWEQVTFIARNAETGEVVAADATPEGPTGHYVARVTFPSAGEWSYTFQLRDLVLEPQAYAPIRVGPSAAVAAPQAPTTANPAPAAGLDPVLVAGGLVLAFLVGTLAGSMLRGPRPGREQVPATRLATR